MIQLANEVQYTVVTRSYDQVCTLLLMNAPFHEHPLTPIC
jgi:hypothetical protein